MTAELVSKLGSVDYRGDRPCVPQDAMLKLLCALDAPRRRLVDRVVALLKDRRSAGE